MRIISKRKIRDYSAKNPQAKIPLTEWYYKLAGTKIENLFELRKKFNSVDSVHGYTVFNVAGNNYRLITAIHYNTQLCYIREIWTHAQYSKKENQDKIERGEL